MTRAIVLLVENDDGSESAAAVLQVDGDVVATTSGEDSPMADGLFAGPTGYAESLAREARAAGDVTKARLEDWVGWIVEDLAGINRYRAVEVAPARDIEYLRGREATLHRPQGWRSAYDEGDEAEPEARQEDASSASQSPLTEGTDRTNPTFSWTAKHEAEAAAPLTRLNPPTEANSASYPSPRTETAQEFWDRLLEESRAQSGQPSRVTILVPPKRAPTE